MRAPISVRPGSTSDLRQTAELLNEIIKIGGTTAITTPLTRDQLGEWLQANTPRSAWHVAIDDDGELLGFQWIGPWPDLPDTACDIATFVKSGRTGHGIGSKLFEATRQAALELGYDWINANIRADNESGLTFYQSRGFRIWNRLENVTLSDGTRVDKVLTRYDLKD